MTLELPPPIAAYVAANARLDVEGMLRPFADDAVFVEVGERLVGRAAVRKLIEEAVIPVKAIFTPDTIRQEGRQVVVEGPARGDFPGSPLHFTYRFELENNTIKLLEVTL